MSDFSLDNLELLFSRSGFIKCHSQKQGDRYPNYPKYLCCSPFLSALACIARAFSVCCRYMFGLLSAFVSWMLRRHIFSHICWFEYGLASRLSLAILAWSLSSPSLKCSVGPPVILGGAHVSFAFWSVLGGRQRTPSDSVAPFSWSTEFCLNLADGRHRLEGTWDGGNHNISLFSLSIISCCGCGFSKLAVLTETTVPVPKPPMASP